jgi:peptidoglycan hydrolase-like protein with peptidoglycan-binding domain
LQYTKFIAAVSAAFLMVAVADAKTARRASSSQRTKAAHTKASHARRSSGPARPVAPTRERYTEIQRALADKGYYAGPVNGEWGPDSVEALKRFQAEQKLAADGKLGALSLIALGLGPHRDTVADLAARPATEPPAGP